MDWLVALTECFARNNLQESCLIIRRNSLTIDIRFNLQGCNMAFTAVHKFIRTEIAGGVFVMLAAVLALLVENSPLSGMYHHFLHMDLGMTIGAFVMIKPMHLWINDGLLCVFFLLV